MSLYLQYQINFYFAFMIYFPHGSFQKIKIKNIIVRLYIYSDFYGNIFVYPNEKFPFEQAHEPSRLAGRGLIE